MSGEFDPGSTVYITTLNAMDDIVQALRAAYANIVGPDGDPGDDGDPGPQGFRGKDGNTVLHGSGAPAETLGNIDDFYVDTAAKTLFGPKKAQWGTSRSLFATAPPFTGFAWDEFTGAAGALTGHTSNSGHSWQDASGYGDDLTAAEIDGAGNFVANANSANVGGFLSVTPPGPDYFVEVDCHEGTDSDIDMQIAGRYDNGSGDAFFFGFVRGSPTTLDWYAYTNAGDLGAGSGSGVAAAGDFTVRLEMIGTAITGKINGSTIFTATAAGGDPTAAGKPMLFMQAAAAGDPKTQSYYKALRCGVLP